MNVIAPLVDTLLALKPPVDVAGPGAVPGMGAVVNDVRLPSRAGMQQLLGADLGSARVSTPAQQVSRFGETTTLSVAARAISAILGAAPDAASGGVRGASPVWPATTAPVPAQLAGALARVVATSGLFYESHLLQFAAGVRPLALLAQEPQARLGALATTHPELREPAQGDADTWLNPGAKTVTAAAISAWAGAASSVEGAEAAMAPKVAEQAPASGSQPAVRTGMPEPQTAVDGPRPGPAGRVDAAYGALRAADAGVSQAVAVDRGANSEGPEEATGQEPRSQAAVSSQVRSGEQGSVTIHPEAVSLVRQQLDMLAMPVFRWGGEAWPGTPMQWDIREEHEDAPAEAEVAAAPRTWSTRLTLTLPTLKEVEVRLSLAGATLQVHLAARENTTIALLSDESKDLPQRFGAVGLQLTGLQIEALAAETAAQGIRKDDGAAKVPTQK